MKFFSLSSKLFKKDPFKLSVKNNCIRYLSRKSKMNFKKKIFKAKLMRIQITQKFKLNQRKI